MTPSTGTDDMHGLRIETVKRENVAWVILQGEGDIATLQQLEDALTRISLDDAESVHLHLDRLDFADVATVRQLTRFARSAKDAGRDLRTCGAQPAIRKVARLLAVHKELGLT